MDQKYHLNKIVKKIDKQISDFYNKPLNNILINRDNLRTWKNDSSTCFYCKPHNETIRHLLYAMIVIMWKKIYRILLSLFYIL